MTEGPAQVRTERYALNGIELSCDEIGEGGLPLLLLHGYTGHREDFLEVLTRSADLGHVLAPDLRGHGDATRTGDAASYHFEQLVDDQRALMDEIKIERCDLLGHSMGGMVALRFALAYPEKLRSLVLMNTSPNLPSTISPAYFEEMGDLARREGMNVTQLRVEESSKRAQNRRPGNDFIEKWAERYWHHHRKRYLAMDPEGYASLGLAMANQQAVTERLAEIRVPTGVIVGSGDTAFLPGSRALAVGIAGARLEVIPDSGHHPHQENPEAWDAALRRVLPRRVTEGDDPR